MGRGQLKYEAQGAFEGTVSSGCHIYLKAALDNHQLASEVQDSEQYLRKDAFSGLPCARP